MSKKYSITKPKPTNFEEILEDIGGLGKFQILVLLTLLSLEFPTAFIGFIPVFTGSNPEWKCDQLDTKEPEICTCRGVLTSEVPSSSIVAEWNLICKFAWIPDFITTIQMIGMIVGVTFASQLADRYGRRYMTLLVAAVLGVGSAISAISPDVFVYTFGRFLCGAGYAAVHCLTGTYAMEFLPTKWRMLISCLGFYGWGTIGLGILAYFIRPWRMLAWVTTIPLFIICPILLLIPESPRFLISVNKTEEAYEVLRIIANINGCEPISMDTFQEAVKKPYNSDEEVKKCSYFDLLHKKELRSITLCLSCIWFAWSFVYIGLYFNIKNMSGNIYLNVIYMGLADAIGFPFSMLILNRFGRRASVFMSMSFGAIFLLSLAILELTIGLDEIPIILLVICILAKFAMAILRCAIKCFTPESYPTEIRNIGSGFVVIASSLGAAIAPQIVYIGTYAPAVPFFVFAFIGVLGTLFTLLIKETNDEPLQESIAQIIGRRISILSGKILL